MTRLTMAFASILVVTTASAALAEDITYFIESYTLTNNRPTGEEYTLSGTIATNGKIGSLSADDIVAYEISANGAVPYVFNSSNASTQIEFLEGLNATEYVIEVVPTMPPDFNGLAIRTADDSASSCSDCVQSIGWGDNPDAQLRGVSYFHRDTFDDDPWVAADVVLESGAPLVIARVPEPSSFALSAIGLIAALGYRRRLRLC